MQENRFTWEKMTAADVNETFEEQMAKFDRHIRKYTFENVHQQNEFNPFAQNLPLHAPG